MNKTRILTNKFEISYMVVFLSDMIRYDHPGFLHGCEPWSHWWSALCGFGHLQGASALAEQQLGCLMMSAILPISNWSAKKYNNSEPVTTKLKKYTTNLLHQNLSVSTPGVKRKVVLCMVNISWNFELWPFRKTECKTFQHFTLNTKLYGKCVNLFGYTNIP